MTMRLGSVVFGANGMPGVVKSKDEVSRELEIDTDRQEVARTHRHGYINGLSVEEREFFNTSLDRISEIENPAERLEAMKKIVDESKSDPKNARMTRYLESEMFHLMQVNNISPRYYTARAQITPKTRNV